MRRLNRLGIKPFYIYTSDLKVNKTTQKPNPLPPFPAREGGINLIFSPIFRGIKASLLAGERFGERFCGCGSNKRKSS
jgi:hypothetical protein